MPARPRPSNPVTVDHNGSDDPPALTTLGQRIRAARQARGWSQEKLADEAAVHWTFVGQVERGRRNLSLHNLLKLSTALGVDPGDLVRGLRPPP